MADDFFRNGAEGGDLLPGLSDESGLAEPGSAPIENPSVAGGGTFAEPAESIDPVDPVGAVAPLKPLASLKPLKPLKPLESLEALTPTGLAEPAGFTGSFQPEPPPLPMPSPLPPPPLQPSPLPPSQPSPPLQPSPLPPPQPLPPPPPPSPPSAGLPLDTPWELPGMIQYGHPYAPRPVPPPPTMPPVLPMPPMPPVQQQRQRRARRAAQPPPPATASMPPSMPFAAPPVPAYHQQRYDRPRYDYVPAATEPWRQRATPPAARGGWRIGFFSLLLVVVFLAGAIAFAVWNNDYGFGQEIQDPAETQLPILPWDPWNPEERPSMGTNPASPGISGNDPMDESGGTELVIVDRPGGVTTPEPGQPLTIRQIADKLLPSVVGVMAFYDGDPVSTGSGVVMTDDGYVITNNHVVEHCDKITIILYSGEEHEVVLCRSDRNTDLAVLKINATGLVAAEFGNSDQMAVGDMVVAIGNPLGMELQSTVTNGIISAINRDIVVEDLPMTMLQTNCAINPGNSGGPLINEYGQVVGIISSKIMSDYFTVVEGLGFAIPSSTAFPIINELISRGFIEGRPAIGITGRAIDKYEAEQRDVVPGFRVEDINPDCDAYRQGMKKGDIITHVNGTEVVTVADINRIKNEFEVGDSLTVTVYRPSEKESLDITFKLMDSGKLTG